MTLIEQARIIAADMWNLAGPNRKAVLNGEWDDIRQVQCALLALETQAAEIARLRGLLGEAEAGLEDVINPLRKIQRDAAEQGARLSGMAYAVANNLHFVRDIARTALSKLRAEKEDG